MACEFLANQLQSVALNSPIIFYDSIPCHRGLVYHEDGTGIFQLRGVNKGCCCNCSSKTTDYHVTFTGNIAIPTGGTVGPIAVAIVINGEPIESSRAIITPAAVDEYGNVTVTKTIKVPWNCCYSMAIECVNGSVNDPTFVPTPTINEINGNLNITPVN